jgi:hypothetical protein
LGQRRVAQIINEMSISWFWIERVAFESTTILAVRYDAIKRIDTGSSDD